MDSKLANEEQLTKVKEKVNKFIEERILKEGKTAYLNKWNYFSLLELEKEGNKDKFLEVVKYIEAMDFEEEDKTSQILTLSYLVVKEKLSISNMDVNDIYLLVSYLDKLELKKIPASLKRLNDKDLLFAIRMKTLDIEIRAKILKYIDKEKKKKQEMLKLLEETEYYDFLKVIE